MERRLLFGDYREKLRAYVRSGSAQPLSEAGEIGRRALALNLGIVDLVLLHESAVEELAREAPAGAGDAAAFLKEALSAYDAGIRSARDANQSLEAARERHLRRLRVLNQIDQAVAGSQSPTVIAGAVIQSVRELLGVPRAVVNRFDLETGMVEWLAAAGRRRVHVGPGVRYPMDLMGERGALERGEPQIVETSAFEGRPEAAALLASGVHVYMVVPMIADGELFGALSFGGEAGHFSQEQMDIAKEVATQLAIAVMQARLYERLARHAEELEQRVLERTAELQEANRHLEAFSYSVAHDLRAPLRSIDGFSRILLEDHEGSLDAEGRKYLRYVTDSAQRMSGLIDALLQLAQVTRAELVRREVDLAAIAREVGERLHRAEPGRQVDLRVEVPLRASGDPRLLAVVLENLIGNAWKFTSRKDRARIELGRRRQDGQEVFFVRDNGAGFDMAYAGKLFGAFQRLHPQAEFEGTGIGLATVQRIIHRHGGRVWAEARPNEGATISFTTAQERR